MLEPLQLLLVVGVVDGEVIGGAILPLALNLELLARGKAGEAQDGYLIAGSNLVVVGRVGKGQAQHALLLQIGLVNAGKALHDDGTTTCSKSAKSTTEHDFQQTFMCIR